MILELETRHDINQNDIEYIKALTKICNDKIHLQTVCGYDLTCKNKNKDLSNYQVRFAFTSLSISVRLFPNIYYSFSGVAVTHCTPVPYNIKNKMVHTHSKGDINIIGWGVGRSP